MAYPPMLVKSNRSMLAAKKLATSDNIDYWNSSVHCSYYSVLQMIIYLLKDVCTPPVNVTELTKDGNSHNCIKDAISMLISSTKERSSFLNGFDYLKHMRVSADYRDKQFAQAECLEIMQTAESLRAKTQSYLKNGK